MNQPTFRFQPLPLAYLLAALAGAAFLSAPSHAALLTYDGDTTTAGLQDGAGAGWNTTNLNWFNGTTNVAWVNANNDTAVFGVASGAAGSVAVTTVTANGITFNPAGSGNYTLTGSTITLAGTTPTITANTNATISSVLAGTAGLVKAGSGILTLSGALNTYSGATTVAAGTLLITGGGAIRATTPINISSGATLEIGGINFLTTGHGTATANIPLAAQVISVNGGTLLMNATAEARVGNITLNNGGTWTSNRGLAGFDVLLANVRTSAGAATVNVAGTGVSTMNGTGGIHLQGVQNFNVADTTSSPAADLNVSLILGGTGSANGAVGGINKLGAGTMALSANNTYLGSTFANAGALVFSGTNTGSAATVSAGAVLRVDYNGTGTGNILDSTKALTIAGGNFNVSGNTTADRAQTFASLTAGAGVGTISVTNNGAAATGLAFTSGTITRTGGGAVNFIPSLAGTSIKVGTAANPLLGAYALYGTTNYAATDATGNVIAAAAGSPTTGINDHLSDAANYAYTSPGATDTLTANRSANTSVFTTAGAQIIDLGGDATANTLTLNGFINNGGALTIQRSGTSTGTVVAGTAANGGLVIGGTSNVSISAPIVNFSGGASSFASANSGTVTLTGANTYTGGTYNNAGTLVISGNGQLNAGTYAGEVTNNGIFNYASSLPQTLSGAISGTGRLEVTGPGAVSISGGNTYLGTTNIGANASLTASGGTGALRGTSALNVATGGTLVLNGTNLLVAGHNVALEDSRVITVNGGTLQTGTLADMRIGNVTLTNGATWTSDRPLTAFDVLLANTTTGAANVNVTGTGASTMNGVGGIHLQGVQNFNVADTTGSTAVDLSVSMILAGPGSIGGAVGGINKTGAGTMLLAAANTYNGTTSISGGTLLLGLATALPGTAPLTLAGSSRLETGGFSNSTGILTLGLGNNVIDFGGDPVANNTLTFANINSMAGTLSVWNWSGTAGAAGLDKLIFTANTGTDLSSINFYSDGGTTLLGGGGALFLSTGTGTGAGELVPVPEPSALMAAFALAGFAMRRRR